MKLKLGCLLIIIDNRMWRKDGKAYSPKNILPTVKFGGGSIMIWGYFSVNRCGQNISNRRYKKKYKKILQGKLMSSFESLELPSDYIFHVG